MILYVILIVLLMLSSVGFVHYLAETKNLTKQLANASINPNSLQCLVKQAKLLDPTMDCLEIRVYEGAIIVKTEPNSFYVHSLSYYKEQLIAKLKDRLDSVSVLSQSIKQLEEHSELDSTMRELDKELSLSPP